MYCKAMKEMGEYNTYNICHDAEELLVGYTTTHVYHVFMYLSKVDYMMLNTFMFATNY